MKIVNGISRAIIAVPYLICGLALGQGEEEEYITHEVRRGETVSLLCIELYGHYSPQMGEAVRSLNPSVKDINLIYAGQKLKMRNPRSTAKPQARQNTVLEKKEGVTQGVVTYVEGAATVSAADGKAAKKKLTANTVVGAGDVLETGKDGRVELIINRESVVRMRSNSRCAVASLRDNARGAGATTVKFSLGTVWAKVKKFSDAVSRFQLELPTAVAGVYGTVYQTSVAADNSAEVKVYDGEVAVKGRRTVAEEAAAGGLTEVEGPHEVAGPHEVSMEEWTQIVRSMQRIRIGKDGAASTPESFEKAVDDWEKWNEERDKRIAEMFEQEF